MKKLSKSMKIVLISVVSCILVAAIVVGCVFAFKGKDDPSNPNNPNNPNNPGGVVVDQVWLDRVALLGNDIKTSNVSNNYDVLLDAPYSGIVAENEIKDFSTNYFKAGKSYYYYHQNNDGTFYVVKLNSRVAAGGFFNDDAISCEIVHMSEKYFVVKNTFDDDNFSYSIIKVKEDGTLSKVYEYKTNATNGEVYRVTDVMFSEDYKFASFLVYEPNNTENEINGKIINLEGGKTFDLNDFNFDNPADIIVKMSGSAVIVYNTADYSCSVSMVNGTQVIKNTFEMEEGVMLNTVTKYLNGKYLLSFFKEISGNEVTKNDYFGDEGYILGYKRSIYKTLSVNNNVISVSDYKTNDGIVKIELFDISENFYRIVEYTKDSNNNLNETLNFKYLTSDNTVVLSYSLNADSISGAVKSLEGKKAFIQNSFVEFSNDSTYTSALNENSVLLSNELVNGVYPVMTSENGEFTISFYNTKGEVVHTLEKNKISNQPVKVSTSNDGWFVTTQNKTYYTIKASDYSVKELGGVLDAGSNFENLSNYNAGIIVVSVDNKYRVYNYAGDVLLDDILRYNILKQSDVFESIKFDCGDKVNVFNLSINGNFTIIKDNLDKEEDKKEEDYKQGDEEQVNVIGDYGSGKDSVINEVDPYVSASAMTLGTSYYVSLNTSSNLYEVWSFTPSMTASYTFYSHDFNPDEGYSSRDTYGYLCNSSQIDNLLNYLTTNHSHTTSYSLANNDDGGVSGVNFGITYTLTAGTTYYLVATTLVLNDRSMSGYVKIDFNFTQMTLNNSYSVSFSSSDHYTVWKYTPTVTGTYYFYTCTCSGDPYGFICNSSQIYNLLNGLDSNSYAYNVSSSYYLSGNDDSGGDLNFKTSYTLTAGTTYYMVVSKYSLSSTTTCNAILSRVYLGNIPAIQLNKDYYLSLNSSTPYQVWQFTPKLSGKYYLTSSDCSNDPIGYLCSSSQYVNCVTNIVDGNSPSSYLTFSEDSDGNNFKVSYNLTAGTTYYFVATDNEIGSTSVSYTCRLTFSSTTLKLVDINIYYPDSTEQSYNSYCGTADVVYNNPYRYKNGAKNEPSSMETYTGSSYTNSSELYMGEYITISNITPGTGMYCSSVTSTQGATIYNDGSTYTYTADYTTDYGDGWGDVIGIQMSWTRYRIRYYKNAPTVSANIYKNSSKTVYDTYSKTYSSNTYTINGSTNTSTYYTASYYNYNQSYTLLTPTLFGFTFAGWATSSTGSKVYNGGQSVSGSNFTQSLTSSSNTIYLYALWTRNQYSIDINILNHNSTVQSYTTNCGNVDVFYCNPFRYKLNATNEPFESYTYSDGTASPTLYYGDVIFLGDITPLSGQYVTYLRSHSGGSIYKIDNKNFYYVANFKAVESDSWGDSIEIQMTTNSFTIYYNGNKHPNAHSSNSVSLSKTSDSGKNFTNSSNAVAMPTATLFGFTLKHWFRQESDLYSGTKTFTGSNWFTSLIPEVQVLTAGTSSIASSSYPANTLTLYAEWSYAKYLVDVNIYHPNGEQSFRDGAGSTADITYNDPYKYMNDAANEPYTEYPWVYNGVTDTSPELYY